MNGFYPAMRQAFVEAGAEVRYLVCEFDEAALCKLRQNCSLATRDPA